MKQQESVDDYWKDNYVLHNSVAPGFAAVDASTQYDPQRGYGWLTSEPRETVAIPLTPYLEVRAAAKDPKNLPRDVLFRDYIRGSGPQKFAVKAPPGDYEVLFLHPDHGVATASLSATDGQVVIPFPIGDWSVSGLILKRKAAEEGESLPAEPQRYSRPNFQHVAPASVTTGSDLILRLGIASSIHVKQVRLYYRPLNQLAKFKMIEHTPEEPFVIPGKDIPTNFDLMYYFEVVKRKRWGLVSTRSPVDYALPRCEDGGK